MRIAAGFVSIDNASPAAVVEAQSPVAMQHSAWHSPVPYLFGGLASMLGLIAFALLILACSYWRLSGYLDSGEGEPDSRGAEGKQTDADAQPPPCFGEGFVVIMAGDEKPTFLATPISSRPSSLADGGKDTAKEEKTVESGVKDEGAHSEGRQGGGDRNQL